MSLGKEFLIIQLTSWTVFLACFIGLSIMAYQCLEQYLKKPQTIDISIKLLTEVDFPSITFCPLHIWSPTSDPLHYNWTRLNACGIKSLGEGKFIDSDLCKNASDLWANSTPKLADLGIDFIWVDVDEQRPDLNISEELYYWKRAPNALRGACYTLKIPKELTAKVVERIGIGLRPGKTLEIFLHPSGMLNYYKAKSSVEYTRHLIQPNQSSTLEVTYQQNIRLDFGTKACKQNNSYDFSDCLDEAMTLETLEKVGCTTPFGKDLSQICLNSTLGMQALDIYRERMMNATCLYPCRYLGKFGLSNTPFATSTA